MTKRLKSKTTVSFQVTFVLPEGVSISEAREELKEAILHHAALNFSTDADLKIHLTNKEVSYGQR